MTYYTFDQENEIIKAEEITDNSGFFETLYFNGNKFPLKLYHLERVAKGLFRQNFIPQDFLSPIEEKLRGLGHTLRVRVDYHIEKKELKTELRFCKYAPDIEKFKVDFFECGNLDNEYNLKKQNRGIYQKAFEWAKNKDLDEAILIDSNGFLLEGSFTNIFILKDDKIYTPPLSNGIVSGCFRRLLNGQPFVTIKSLTKQDYENADEVFLTNALRGIIPVKTMEDSLILKLREKFHLDKL